MSRKRNIAIGAGIAATGAALRRRKSRVPTDPFDPNAIRAETAAERTADLVARPRVRRADVALTFAPAIATSVEPLLHGRRYFPRILEDIAAAKDHVHLLIYGYKPGDIGDNFLEALTAKVAEGVEVRLAVDAIGSEIDGGSKGLYRQLLAAGIEVDRPRRHRRRAVRHGRRSQVRAEPGGPPPLRSSQDGRRRRERRLRRWQRDRGPLQRRALLRRHGAGSKGRSSPSWRPSS